MNKQGNTSSAVREQRHEVIDALDDYPTPPWATRALLREILIPHGVAMNGRTVWEPACNRGYMARPLAEHFTTVLTSDVADYGWIGQQHVADFLTTMHPQAKQGVDWIITNPPFNKAEEFVNRALAIASEGVAIIARVALLEGGDRYRDLYSKRMPWIVAQHVERVPMNRGNYDPANGTATAYSWFIWRKGWGGDHFKGTWVPKCRDRYEFPEDVNYEIRDGECSDFIAKNIADTPLFASSAGT